MKIKETTINIRQVWGEEGMVYHLSGLFVGDFSDSSQSI